MKVKFLLFCVMLLVSRHATPAMAGGQARPDRLQALSLDLFGPITMPIGYFRDQVIGIPVDVQFQRVLYDHLVLSIHVGFSYNWNLDASDWNLLINPRAELQWHPWKAGLDGLYFALIGAFEYDSSYHGEQSPGINYLFHIPLGVTLGWGFCLPMNLLLNVELFGVGFGYNGGVWADGAQNSSFGFAGIPNGGIYLGYAF